MSANWMLCTAFLDEMVWRPVLIGFVWPDRGRNVRSSYREAFRGDLTSESQACVETLLFLGSITDDPAASRQTRGAQPPPALPPKSFSGSH